MQESKLTKRQEKKFTKQIKVDGRKGRIEVKVRYDDSCNNGYNTFAITGTVYSHASSSADRYLVFGGCIHDQIAKYMPELEHLIKWHLTTSECPTMHYVENTLYWARDRDYPDKEIGEAVKWAKRLKFDKYPFTFSQQEKGFWDYLDGIEDFNAVEIVSIKYNKEIGTYDFNPKYSFKGFIKDDEHRPWYNAPFSTERVAEEFLKALQESSYKYVEIPTAWCEAEESNLENARKTALWEDATLEQLRNKELLVARIPELREKFIADIEEFGFEF